MQLVVASGYKKAAAAAGMHDGSVSFLFFYIACNNSSSDGAYL
jgi:hypothetical protein